MKCFAPWTNIDISPNGTIKPCCKFNMRFYTDSYQLPTNSLDSYLESVFLKQVREELEQGIFPKGCERCEFDEQAGIESKRQLDYNRWKEAYDNYQISDGFITAGIAFGNTCNLTCITCNPSSSSKWRQEWKDLYGIDTPSFKNVINDDLVEQFLSVAPNLIHIDMHGGEPFLSQIDKQKDLLQHYINIDQSKNITIHYTTNGQQYPDNEFWELWSNFKEVDMQLSIDGIAERYEYIRYPANWDTLVDNVRLFINNKKKLDNIRLSVSHTVSAYNVYYLEEFFIWCIKTGLPKPYLGRVNHPARLSPEVWHDEAKKAIVEKLQSSKVKEVQQWANILLNNKSDAKHNEFVSYAKQHDKYRGTSFVTTFPELENFFKEINNDN